MTGLAIRSGPLEAYSSPGCGSGGLAPATGVGIMRGSLSRDGHAAVDGDVVFSDVPWSGVFSFPAPERVSIGEYMLTLDDGQSQSIVVTKVTRGTHQDAEAVFTKSMRV